MILWTIQSQEVYRIIEETGVYHCNPSKSMFSFLEKQYSWLSEQMRRRVGEPPKGVVFPVWAICGSSIQATFGELRREQIRSVRFFEGAKKRP